MADHNDTPTTEVDATGAVSDGGTVTLTPAEQTQAVKDAIKLLRSFGDRFSVWDNAEDGVLAGCREVAVAKLAGDKPAMVRGWLNLSFEVASHIGATESGKVDPGTAPQVKGLTEAAHGIADAKTSYPAQTANANVQPAKVRAEADKYQLMTQMAGGLEEVSDTVIFSRAQIGGWLVVQVDQVCEAATLALSNNVGLRHALAPALRYSSERHEKGVDTRRKNQAIKDQAVKDTTTKLLSQQPAPAETKDKDTIKAPVR